VPLGGPPFKDLISEGALRNLRSWPDYDAKTLPGGYKPTLAAEVLCRVYHAGKGDRTQAFALWSDAEQFIEVLDIARQDHVVANQVEATAAKAREAAWKEKQSFTGADDPLWSTFQWLERDIQALHNEAVRFIAGICSTFLLRAENPKIVDHTELWHPYRRWVVQLKPGLDTLISFNHDRGLDILADHLRRVKPKRDLLITPVDTTLEHFDALLPTCVPMYHLHGHVGWLRTDDGNGIDPGPADPSGFHLHLPRAHKYPERAVMGVPGEHKLNLPATLLKAQWDRAIAAIGQAHVVAFVGYRFPPTDNMAKARLHDALAANPSARIRIVLGPGSPDAPRLQGMIDSTGRHTHAEAKVLPMWAEDFFSVFDRNRF